MGAQRPYERARQLFERKWWCDSMHGAGGRIGVEGILQKLQCYGGVGVEDETKAGFVEEISTTSPHVQMESLAAFS